MTSETSKVSLACAIGAFVGSLIALEMTHYFWWIGLIVGGLTGYLSYQWRVVIAAIPAAYHAARGWRPPAVYWENVRSTMALDTVLLSWLSLFLATACLVADSYLGPLASIGLTIAISWLVMNLLWMVLMLGLDYPEFDLSPKEMLYYGLPPIVLFWHLPQGIWWLMRRIPRATVMALAASWIMITTLALFTRRFTWHLFLRIHSEIRLLCAFDAALGTAVGYFAGSSIVGALAGGLFGVINYVVVTERWLRPYGYLPVRKD